MSTGREPPPGPPRRELPRTLRLATAVALVIGSVIGSGIFKKAAPMADVLPSPLLVLAIWVFAGVITCLGALSAAELTAAFPESGGLYAHLRRTMGEFTGFVYGWSVLTVIQTGSIASIAYVFAQYLRYFLDWGALPPELESWGATVFGVDLYPLRDLFTKLVAVACIVSVTVINTLRVGLGAAVLEFFTGLKLLVVLGVIAIAAFAAGDVGEVGHFTGPSFVPEGMSGMALAGAVTLALSGAFWAYDGWINVTFVAAELRDPARSAPRALVGGLLVVIVAYLAVNAAYFWLLPVEAVRGSDLVVADALARVLPAGAAVASAAVVISTFGAVNGNTMASARVFHAMAHEGWLPARIADVHPRFRSPHVALGVQGVWAAALVFSGTFDQITDMLIFVSWGFYGLLAAAVIVARVRFPDAPRPYRVPGYPVVPALFVLIAGAFLVLSVLENTRNATAGALLVAPAVPIYALVRWRRWRSRLLADRAEPDSGRAERGHPPAGGRRS